MKSVIIYNVLYIHYLTLFFFFFFFEVASQSQYHFHKTFIHGILLKMQYVKKINKFYCSFSFLHSFLINT